jgi:hypothetical protein
MEIADHLLKTDFGRRVNEIAMGNYPSTFFKKMKVTINTQTTP